MILFLIFSSNRRLRLEEMVWHHQLDPSKRLGVGGGWQRNTYGNRRFFSSSTGGASSSGGNGDDGNDDEDPAAEIIGWCTIYMCEFLINTPEN